jgi:hypothetical protein
MDREKLLKFTPADEQQLAGIRKLAESLGVRLEQVVRAGSQGTVLGVQSDKVMLSQRTDSRTVFIHDLDFDKAGDPATGQVPDDEYLKLADGLLQNLNIPRTEIAERSVLKEQNQVAQFDAATGKAKVEDPTPGRRYAFLGRAVDGLPVWSSRVMLGMTPDRRVGFLEAHWPEIPKNVLEEAKRLAEMVKGNFKPPERSNTKIREVQAGILHSPAAGFVMDIYAAIRVVYEPTDERYGKAGVAYLDANGKDVPIPRQFDIPPEQPVEPREAGNGGIELRRARYRELLLANSPVLQSLQMDTSYEELGCVGYQPQFRKLEAVVYVKKHFGYGGDLCSPGSPEYVRFYLSYDNGATWVDQGVANFTAWNMPFPGDRLEYAVTLDINPSERLCFSENLPLARAILSWNSPPPANTPNYHPHWGNVRDARIQIAPRKLIIFSDLATEFKLKLPEALTAVVDTDQPVTLKKKALTASDLIAEYKGKEVPPHRFLASEVMKYVAKPQVAFSPALLDANWTSIVDALLATNGDTTYEELTCIGLDPNRNQLNGVIHVKLPSGFSGPLCSTGSLEYVAFWIDYGSGWTYAGTTSVSVHDIKTMPAGGLNYAVFLPVDLQAHRKPCHDGPVTARVRAILSWNAAPPPGNPNFRPHWGNRLETRIHIGPSSATGMVPFLSSVGDVAEIDIDASGKANGSAIHTGLVLSDSPFGGRITVAGHIPSPVPGMKYRIMKKPHGAPDSSYAPLTFDPLSLFINTWTMGTGWTQTYTVVNPDSNGYYPYEDYSWDHSVETSLMGEWYSSAAEDGNAYDLRIDLNTDGNPAHDLHSNVVTVLVDNRAPDAALAIDLGGGVQCADFAPGATFTGTFSCTDTHFRSFSFEIQPSGPPNDPAHGVLPSPASGMSVEYGGVIGDPGVLSGTFTLNTGVNPGPPPTGPMDPCGYALILHVSDRTNVNSGGGHNTIQRSVGFCLQIPHE